MFTVNSEIFAIFYYCEKCEWILIAIIKTRILKLCGCSLLQISKNRNNKTRIIFKTEKFAIINARNNF